MEFILEPVLTALVELALWILSATIGVALATVAYAVWVLVRRRLWHLDKSVTVHTPDGRPYLLDVPGLQVQTPLSRWLARQPRHDPSTPPEWTERDALHPGRLSDTNDDLVIVLAPLILGFVVVLLTVVFLIELIIGLALLGSAATVATMIRHRWTCRVTDPSGMVWVHRARGLRRVRRVRDHLAERITAGDDRAVRMTGATRIDPRF